MEFLAVDEDRVKRQRLSFHLLVQTTPLVVLQWFYLSFFFKKKFF